MLKVRIMPTLLLKKVGLVKGVGFDSQRRVGSAMQAVKVYNLREVDELVLLDISATLENSGPDFEAIDELADECFMPLCVGGGIRSVDDVQKLLKVGADKISLNSAAVKNPKLVEDVAKAFGSQCVVVSIDFKIENNLPVVYSHCGTVSTGLNAIEWAQKVASLGAGEILLTSIERDGAMNGYDCDVIQKVANGVRVPVIASGGAGNYEDFAKALRAGANAVAAASIFHFTEQTPLEAKRYLSKEFPVRLAG